MVLTHFFGQPKVRPDDVPRRRRARQAVIGMGRERDARGRRGGHPGRADRDRPRAWGWASRPEQDLDLLHRLAEVAALGRPVFVPISNKKVSAP